MRGDHFPHFLAYTRTYAIQRLQFNSFVQLISYGAAIRTLRVPDRNGKVEDVTLGFDDLDGYRSKHGKNPYFGASVGRVGNRIANATFTLDGETIELAKNNGPNGLHGGLRGLDKVVWNGYPDEEVANRVHFGFVDKDGANNYRGKISLILATDK